MFLKKVIPHKYSSLKEEVRQGVKERQRKKKYKR
jgi:hypothetical protein